MDPEFLLNKKSVMLIFIGRRSVWIFGALFKKKKCKLFFIFVCFYTDVCIQILNVRKELCSKS